MKKGFLLSVVLLMLAFLCKAQPVTITPPSANIQPGESVTLRASGAMYYTWSPATGLSTTEGPVTVASPMVTTTYTCSGYAPGDESVVNGDFNQGNVGFTSAYQYNSNLWAEGTYYVDYDASLHHESFVGLGHNGGNFMMVNGATSPGTNVWTEQITVHPNTYYAFSTWVCTLAGTADQVALLQFSINGTQIGNVFSAPPYTNEWRQFYELWYSGNSTSATITILNQNTVGSGNDFGLDDISFCELVLVGAPECTVYVGSMSATATADETELCEDASTTLHALPVNGSGNYTFSWSPANTLDDPTSQHPVATPTVGTTNYTCQINDVGWGNEQVVSVAITVHPKKEKHIDAAICSYETYDFNGVALDSTGQYVQHLQTQYNCDSVVVLDLTVYPANDTILVDPSICFGDSYDFHGTLYDQDGQMAYFDTIDHHGCRMVEKLVLTVSDYQMPPMILQYECYPFGGTPSWYWDKTETTYHQDVYDEIILPDPEGDCPILHRLNLRFHENFFREVYKDTCDYYVWPVTGDTLFESQERIEKVLQSEFGDKLCDSTFVLHLQLEYSPNPSKIQCSDASAVVYSIDPLDPNVDDTIAVVTNTEFFSFQYTFFIEETNSECVWDSCYWTISKPSWSIEFDSVPTLSEDGKYYSECKVYVAERDNNYVQLTSTIANGCGTKERVFYLKSSFLDVEENGQVMADFNVVPNPNNGQMTLVFDHFEGKVDVNVYDVMGNLMDSFETYSDADSKTVAYGLNARNGMYFIVANGKNGTVAKKVEIDR